MDETHLQTVLQSLLKELNRTALRGSIISALAKRLFTFNTSTEAVAYSMHGQTESDLLYGIFDPIGALPERGSVASHR